MFKSILRFAGAGAGLPVLGLVLGLIACADLADGQTKIRGVDTNHKPLAFAKIFEVEGLKAIPRGEVFEFVIEAEEPAEEEEAA